MDISNATMYDAASACAEAVLMAVRISKKNKVLVSQNLNPEYIDVIKTYCWANEIELNLLMNCLKKQRIMLVFLSKTLIFTGK